MKKGLLGIGCVLVVAGVVVASLGHNPPTRNTGAATPASPSATHVRPAPREVIATVAAAGGGPGALVADVSRLTPVQAYNVSGLRTGPVRIGGTAYTDSVRFTCDSGARVSSGDLDYVVTGYGSMSATIGIPSDDTRAAGDTMSVSFFNNGSGPQTAGPYTITLGHPRQVHVRFTASSQLEISCAATTPSGKPAPMDLALANATIAPR